jgi:hypothetical protein
MPFIASTDLAWLILAAPLVVAAALIGLKLYLRGGPRTAHGFTLSANPRRRREVPGWVLTLSRPLFAYDARRHAYVLRGVGSRFGPVLRERRPPVTERTGRFDRAKQAETRAPVGARGTPPAED